MSESANKPVRTRRTWAIVENGQVVEQIGEWAESAEAAAAYARRGFIQEVVETETLRQDGFSSMSATLGQPRWVVDVRTTEFIGQPLKVWAGRIVRH